MNWFTFMHHILSKIQSKSELSTWFKINVGKYKHEVIHFNLVDLNLVLVKAELAQNYL